MNLTRNGLIVLISVIFVAGAGTAYAGIVLPNITLAGNVVITGDTELDGKLLDTNNDAGTSGQVLSSTETGIDWIDGTGMRGVGPVTLTYTGEVLHVEDTGLILPPDLIVGTTLTGSWEFDSSTGVLTTTSCEFGVGTCKHYNDVSAYDFAFTGLAGALSWEISTPPPPLGNFFYEVSNDRTNTDPFIPSPADAFILAGTNSGWDPLTPADLELVEIDLVLIDGLVNTDALSDEEPPAFGMPAIDLSLFDDKSVTTPPSIVPAVPNDGLIIICDTVTPFDCADIYFDVLTITGGLATGGTGATGMTGMKGATGMTGMKGMTGMDGFSEFTFVFQYDTTDIFIVPGDSLIFSSSCPFSTEFVVSGGVEELIFETKGFFLAESYPFDFDTWVVRVENTSPFIVDYKIWIVCLDFFSFPASSSLDASTSEAREAREGIVLEPIPFSEPKNIREN